MVDAIIIGGTLRVYYEIKSTRENEKVLVAAAVRNLKVQRKKKECSCWSESRDHYYSNDERQMRKRKSTSAGAEQEIFLSKGS